MRNAVPGDAQQSSSYCVDDMAMGLCEARPTCRATSSPGNRVRATRVTLTRTTASSALLPPSHSLLCAFPMRPARLWSVPGRAHHVTSAETRRICHAGQRTCRSAACSAVGHRVHSAERVPRTRNTLTDSLSLTLHTPILRRCLLPSPPQCERSLKCRNACLSSLRRHPGACRNAFDARRWTRTTYSDCRPCPRAATRRRVLAPMASAVGSTKATTTSAGRREHAMQTARRPATTAVRPRVPRWTTPTAAAAPRHRVERLGCNRWRIDARAVVPRTGPVGERALV